MKNFFKNIWTSFEDALFVNFSCMFCGIETINESLVCPKCEAKLKFINAEVCKKCGSSTEKSEDICYNCFDKKYIFNNHRSCIIYDKLSSRPIRNLKYNNAKYLAEPIARFMYAVHREIIESADYLVFVPMTNEKMESRGYNHTEELTKHISEISKIPVLNLLVKTKETESQAGLGFIDRTENLKGSFAVKSEYSELIKGKNIVIVDDVFTTGSTSNECSRCIKKFKPKNISVITFLKTDPNKDYEDLPF